MVRRSCIASVVLLVAMMASCYGFQAFVPASVARKVQRPPPLYMFFADEDDAPKKKAGVAETAEADTEADTTSTEIAATKFESKEPAEKSTGGGAGANWFSFVLIGYVIFVIVDTVFHITPDKPYSEVLVDAVKGVADAGGDVVADVVSGEDVTLPSP